MNSSKVATRLREQVMKFSGEVSAGLGRVPQRFVAEMVYGIQASQSVVLTEIARTLEEEISIKKTEERLSRNLRRAELEKTVQENVTRMASRGVGEETLLIIDPSDVSKKYAKKMEYLATVRDGSEGELATGYWTLHVIGTELESPEIVPLYQRLYSANAPQFVSENAEILRAIDAVCAEIGRKGLWIMDRGGDRIHLFEPMLERKLKFLFRLVGDRDLVWGGGKVLAREVAVRCPCPYSETIVKEQQGKEKVYTLSFGYREVGLPGRPERLFLLVIRGLGEEPLMLLTNRPLRRSRKVLWRLVRAYFRRWSIEDTIRFIKQSYDLENVRVLKYPGLQNLLPLLLAVMYFAAVVLDTRERLKIMASYVLKAARRVFGIPDFKYYALADGLRSLFARHPGHPRRPSRAPDPQILLFSLESS
jgi:hypothetical protein